MRLGATLWLLGVLGCNQAFRLRETELIDGPPSELPPECPPIGETPTFAGALVIAIDRPCIDFSISGQFAAASCDDGIYVGRADGVLERAIAFDLATSDLYSNPRVTPDGLHLYLIQMNVGPSVQPTVEEYVPAGGGAWTHAGTASFVSFPTWLSSFARAPDGDRMIVRDDAGPGPYQEWTLADGKWQPGAIVASLDFAVNAPMMTGDGLRLLAIGTNTYPMPPSILFTDRGTVDAAFGPLRPMPTVPAPDSYPAFMTENCGRVYLSGLGSLYYLRHR